MNIWAENHGSQRMSPNAEEYSLTDFHESHQQVLIYAL